MNEMSFELLQPILALCENNMYKLFIIRKCKVLKSLIGRRSEIIYILMRATSQTEVNQTAKKVLFKKLAYFRRFRVSRLLKCLKCFRDVNRKGLRKPKKENREDKIVVNSNYNNLLDAR